MKKISMKSVIMGSVLAVAAVSSLSANAATQASAPAVVLVMVSQLLQVATL
jgi:hypothetical protein